MLSTWTLMRAIRAALKTNPNGTKPRPSLCILRICRYKFRLDQTSGTGTLAHVGGAVLDINGTPSILDNMPIQLMGFAQQVLNSVLLFHSSQVRAARGCTPVN